MPFYCQEKFQTGNTVFLDAEESRHALKVMRLRQGAQIQLMDGQGGTARGVLNAASGKQASVTIDSVEVVAQPESRLHLYCAPPANKLMSQIVRQCAEMGVASIQLVETCYSVSKPKGKGSQEWKKDALAALKQSANPWMIEVKPMISFAEALAGAVYPSYYGAVPCEAAGFIPSREWKGDRILWVGPEGGFSPQEIEALNLAKVQPLCASPYILRVETAVVAAVALLQPVL